MVGVKQIRNRTQTHAGAILVDVRRWGDGETNNGGRRQAEKL